MALGRAPALPAPVVEALRGRGCPAADALDRLRPRPALPDDRELAAHQQWLAQPGHALITLSDPAYPLALAEIGHPPPVLWVRGAPILLSAPQVALVGARKATPSGRELAFELAAGLAAAGLVVTSGLAEGIDAAAHEGALQCGRTLAVAGCGPDQVYPRRHTALAERVVAGGALVSEFELGTPPRAANFPRRNRVVTGLSRGVVVVEAMLRSGSLISARLAGEQGREVFAVPGPVQSPLSRGCHALIRQGACLVERVEDILEELRPWGAPPGPQGALPGLEQRPQARPEPGSDEDKVLKSMDYSPVSLEDLAARSGLTARALCSILLKLELQGAVAALSGGRYVRRRFGR